MVQFVILCVREFQIVRMKSRFSLFCFEKLILIFSFSCSSFCTFSFPLLFSVKMCSAVVFDRPLPICKIHPKQIWRLSRETPVIASRAAGPQMRTGGHSSGGRALQVLEMKFRRFPAKPEHVALYLQYLMDTIQSHSSVDMAIYVIQWALSLAGLQSPTDSPNIHAVREAAKRLNGKRLVNRKDPVSLDMIRKI